MFKSYSSIFLYGRVIGWLTIVHSTHKNGIPICFEAKQILQLFLYYPDIFSQIRLFEQDGIDGRLKCIS